MNLCAIDRRCISYKIRRRDFATDRLQSGEVHEGEVARLANVWVSHMAPLGSAVGSHPRYCRKNLAACEAVRGDGHSVMSAMGKVRGVWKGN